MMKYIIMYCASFPGYAIFLPFLFSSKSSPVFSLLFIFHSSYKSTLCYFSCFFHEHKYIDIKMGINWCFEQWVQSTATSVTQRWTTTAKRSGMTVSPPTSKSTKNATCGMPSFALKSLDCGEVGVMTFFFLFFF